MAGVDKDAINMFYMTLLNQGKIDLESFLAVAEIPKKEVLIKRMEGKNEETAQAQQAIQALQAQLQALQTENVTLKGALDSNRLSEVELMNPDEKKLLDQELKKSAISNMIAPSQQDATGNLQDVNPQQSEPAMANQI